MLEVIGPKARGVSQGVGEIKIAGPFKFSPSLIVDKFTKNTLDFCLGEHRIAVKSDQFSVQTDLG